MLLEGYVDRAFLPRSSRLGAQPEPFRPGERHPPGSAPRRNLARRDRALQPRSALGTGHPPLRSDLRRLGAAGTALLKAPHPPPPSRRERGRQTRQGHQGCQGPKGPEPFDVPDVLWVLAVLVISPSP